MNRLTNVFLATMLCSTYAFSQSTNIVGTGVENIDLNNLQYSGSGEPPANYAVNVENVATLDVSNSSDFTGGAGGDFTATGAAISKNGGAGLRLTDVGTVTADDTKLVGGKGANIVADNGLVAGFTAESEAGHGIEVNGTSNLDLGTGVVAQGGLGAEISNDNGRARSFGGDGFNRYVSSDSDASVAVITIAGGSYYGGAGGTVSYNNSAALDPAGWDDVFFDNQSGARGGNGLRVTSVYNWYNAARSGSVVINDGEFSGGKGGTANNSGTGPVVAHGGHGLLVDNTDLTINGGSFSGGGGGSENGSKASDGYGVRTQDSNVTITDGTFANQGILFESHYIDSTALISGGTFGKAIFTATADEYYPSVERSSTVDISGGTFDAVEFNGTAFNNLTLSGGTFGALDFNGSNNTASITGGTIGKITVKGGMTDVNAWDDAVFADTTVSNGTLNFNNQAFNMVSGSSLVLADENAAVNFGTDAVIDGSVDVNKGAVTVGSSLTVKSGSTLSTTIYADGAGVSGGTISAETATFEDDVSWTLVNDGTITNSDSLSDGVLLASANVNDGITHSFDPNGIDFNLIGNPSVLLGINGVTNYFNAGTSQQELYAMYGQSSLEKIFEDNEEILPAMSDLQMVLDGDPELSAYISSEWSDYDTLNQDFSEAFIRTPEMASALMGLQGIFADQVRDRTRSNLRFKKFGSKTSYAPSGARGPDWSNRSTAPSGARGPDWYDSSVQWTKDHTPTWDAKGAARTASDNAPMPSGDAMKDSIDNVTPSSSGEGIEVPETYQVWGRAYGSRLDQGGTAGFSGYDATILGGVIGVDQRFEKLLVGLGAGYANTDLSGKGGNDGEADTAYGMVYLSRSSDSLYFDATLNYAYNDVETKGVSSVGYESEYVANTVGFGIGTGYGISFNSDKLLFTPEASYLGTYYNRGDYTEKSNLATPFPDKNYESYDQWSHLTSIGATLSTIGVLDYFNAELEYQPELRAHWLHEFNAEMDNDTYTMVGGSGDPLAVALQAREEDLIRLGAGIRFSKWDSDATEFGFDIDGAFGGEYQNYIVSGKIMHRF